jgi:hypothetical protein
MGAIAGGTVGGVIAIVAVSFLAFYLMRRHRNINSAAYEAASTTESDKGPSRWPTLSRRSELAGSYPGTKDVVVPAHEVYLGGISKESVAPIHGPLDPEMIHELHSD